MQPKQAARMSKEHVEHFTSLLVPVCLQRMGTLQMMLISFLIRQIQNVKKDIKYILTMFLYKNLDKHKCSVKWREHERKTVHECGANSKPC